MTATTDLIDKALLVKGARFIVTAEGAYLSGMESIAPFTWQGKRVDLAVGDVITCRGFGPGFGSDPGRGYHFDVEGAEPLAFAEFHPSGGHPIWSYGQPAASHLAPAEEVES